MENSQKLILKFFFWLQELKDCKSQMTDLTNQWYQAIRVSPNESETEEIVTAEAHSSFPHS